MWAFGNLCARLGVVEYFTSIYHSPDLCCVNAVIGSCDRCCVDLPVTVGAAEESCERDVKFVLNALHSSSAGVVWRGCEHHSDCVSDSLCHGVPLRVLESHLSAELETSINEERDAGFDTHANTHFDRKGNVPPLLRRISLCESICFSHWAAFDVADDCFTQGLRRILKSFRLISDEFDIIDLLANYILIDGQDLVVVILIFRTFPR